MKISSATCKLIIKHFQDNILSTKSIAKLFGLSADRLKYMREDFYLLPQEKLFEKYACKECRICKINHKIELFNFIPSKNQKRYIEICQLCQNKLLLEAIENEGKFRTINSKILTEEELINLENSELNFRIEFIMQVIDLYNKGIGVTNSKKILGSEYGLKEVLKLLNLEVLPKVSKALFKTENWCAYHKKIEPLINFRTTKVYGREFYGSYCVEATKMRMKIYSPKYSKKYTDDPFHKLHNRISCLIREALKSQGSSKAGHSFIKFVDFTIMQLKNHFERYFKDPGNEWMNWNNWKKYDCDTWDDNDQSTWTWNLDHIISRALLPYASMNDLTFKITWVLRNLRPLSAKQNILDGNRGKKNKILKRISKIIIKLSNILSKITNINPQNDTLKEM